MNALLCALLLLSASPLLIPSPSHAQAPVTTLDGTLHIVWADPHPELAWAGAISYSLELSDGSRVPLELTGQDAAAAQHFRQRVRVSGRLVQRRLAEATTPAPPTMIVDSIADLRGLERADALLAPEAAVSGTRKVIYLLLQFADDAAVPHAPAFYTDLTNPLTPPSGLPILATVNGFFSKTSWGQVTWSGDVGGVGGVGAPGGWLKLPNPKSYYAPCGWSDACADLQAIFDDGTALGRAQGIVFTNYDNINIVLSNDLDCCAYGGSFYSSVDRKAYGVTWEPPWGQEANTYSHELGHSLGLPHSGWVYYAYDSPWDVMSRTTPANSAACGSYVSANSGASTTV